MENKNGFTLIELLAIIVILSIIAVITVSVVLNIIDDSKKGSTKDSACGYVFEFVDFIGILRINPTRTNVGGWPGSELYDYVNTDFYSKLPFELQNNIAETYVVSGHGSKPGEENFESIDKLYLLSRNELLGDYSEGDTSSGYTRQLDYYASGDSTLSKSRDWWLRSIYCCNNDSMYLMWSVYLILVLVFLILMRIL